MTPAGELRAALAIMPRTKAESWGDWFQRAASEGLFSIDEVARYAKFPHATLDRLEDDVLWQNRAVTT